MLNETFYLDDKDALTYGIRLQKPIEFTSAVPIVEKIHVPGRNGDLIFDTGTYENRTGIASCFALSSSVNNEIVKANKFLLSDHGYRKLTCSNDTTHFWKARVSNGAKIENRLNKLNPFEIEFDCMPQRFLVSGENTITITTSSRVLTNSYGGVALPLIKIYKKSGSALENSSVVQIGSSSVAGFWVKDGNQTSSLTFDCETQNVYSEDLNLNFNDRVTIANGFPKLDLGTNVIKFNTNCVEKIEVIPRWWDL
jgi:phage-related protein